MHSVQLVRNCMTQDPRRQAEKVYRIVWQHISTNTLESSTENCQREKRGTITNIMQCPDWLRKPKQPSDKECSWKERKNPIMTPTVSKRYVQYRNKAQEGNHKDRNKKTLLHKPACFTCISILHLGHFHFTQTNLQ